MILNKKFIELKYKFAWYLGVVLSFILYFSGVAALYSYLRRRCPDHHIAIVLMYHRISDDNGAYDISVSSKNFERQVSYLKKNYDVIPLDELVSRHRCNNWSGKDAVAVTFDDGYKDNYINAYPILRKYNIPATVFVITGSVGQDPKMLNDDEIRIMQKGNITFGAHTITHKILSKLDREAASLEISGSKSALEKILQEKVKYFAYPKGKKRDFTDETMQIVEKTGYSAAFSTENGYINGDSNIFAFSRLGMRDYPLFVFKVRVSGIFENRWFYALRRYAGLT